MWTPCAEWFFFCWIYLAFFTRQDSVWNLKFLGVWYGLSICLCCFCRLELSKQMARRFWRIRLGCSLLKVYETFYLIIVVEMTVECGRRLGGVESSLLFLLLPPTLITLCALVLILLNSFWGFFASSGWFLVWKLESPFSLSVLNTRLYLSALILHSEFRWSAKYKQ